jgi:hypothetical protein
MTQDISGSGLLPSKLTPETHFASRKSLMQSAGIGAYSRAFGAAMRRRDLFAKAVIGRDTMTGRVLLEGRALQIPDCGHIAESVSSMSCVHIGCGKPRSCCGSALGFRMRRLFARVKMVCRYSRTP